jgi:hypothetical protein
MSIQVFKSVTFSWRKLAARAAGFCAAGAVVVLTGTGADAQAKCRPVVGHFDLHPVTGPACTSPVGVCANGTLSGVLRGDYTSAFSSIIPTADTPTTGVVLFTADTTAHVRLGGLSGDLTFQESGASHTTGGGEFVELYSITSGTGALAGASGTVYASGTYDPASGGEADYHGNICVP